MNALYFSSLMLGLLVGNPHPGDGFSSDTPGMIEPTFACSTPCEADCDDDCTVDCERAYRWPPARVRTVARYSEPCGDTCEEPCGRPCNRGACSDRTPTGPLTLVFSLFTRDTWCGSGCGERYWGDFYSDPPTRCDPCDRSGNYIGRSYGTVRSSNGIVVSGGSSGGCNCNKHRDLGDEPIPREGKVISQSTRVVTRQPTPVKKSTAPQPR